MKKALCIYFLLQSIFAVGQNVGIGTNAPAQKLDVNGNINVSGNIQVNNTAGQPNQVLMTNSNGNTVWGNYCDFKYSVSFQTTPAGQWTVPAGVTKIMIEAWGGGGGGAAGGGGGSGAYAQTVVNVTPGSALTITVGTGGVGAANQAANGLEGTASQTSGAAVVYASFGNGATAITPGLGGNNAYTTVYILVYGNNGNPTIETYAQRSSTEYVTIRKYGDGGKAVMFNSNEGTGSTFTFNTVTLSNISLIKSMQGTAAGAGGGGGPDNGISWGARGSDGLVIIRY